MTHPIDWTDMPLRLKVSEDKVRSLTIEVQALRELTVDQAVEIARLKREQNPVEIGGTDALPPAMAGIRP